MSDKPDSPQAIDRTPAEPSTPGEGTSLERCTLTDEEREAIHRAVLILDGVEDLLPNAGALDAEAVTTLRSLLERTK